MSDNFPIWCDSHKIFPTKLTSRSAFEEMIAIKLFFKNETRRAQIYTDQNDLTFALLVSTAQNLFPALRGKSNLEFYWNDEDNDTIVVSSDDELTEAARVMSNDNRKVMRFEIRENEDGELLTSYPVPEATIAREINMAVHINVRCDNCDVCPIVGARYKCAVREDYDLCELCESKEAQPHPMIKINSPDQAPAAILITVRDGQIPRGPWRGAHQRGHGPHGHHHHHGHNHHPHDGPNPPGPPPHPHPRNTYGQFDSSFTPGPHCGPGQYWRRMMRHNDRRAAVEAAAQGAGGWLATAEAFAKTLSNEISDFTDGSLPEEATASPGNHNESATIDQDFLDEAVRQSLADSTLNSTPVATTDSPVEVLPASTAATISTPIAVSIPAAPLSKPMARFVRDVTFPDGTSVQPGSIFLKTWRIRNDGPHSWPDKVVLTCAGGDSLSAVDVALPVDSLSAGSEAEITLQLSAPERTGRHVAYFRMKTSEGVYFGQRLWADIRVIDDDQGWHLLGGMLGTSIPSPSEGSIDSNSVVQHIDAVIEDSHFTSSSTIASTPNAQAVDSLVSDNDAEHMGSSQSSVVAVWTRVWSKELQILSDMGFTNSSTALTLLQKHLGIPVSLSSPESNVSPEGMQNVISELLAEQDDN